MKIESNIPSCMIRLSFIPLPGFGWQSTLLSVVLLPNAWTLSVFVPSSVADGAGLAA